MTEKKITPESLKRFLKNYGVYFILVICFAAAMIFAKYVNDTRAVTNINPVGAETGYFCVEMNHNYSNSTYLIELSKMSMGDNDVYKFDIKEALDTIQRGIDLEYSIYAEVNEALPITFVLRRVTPEGNYEEIPFDGNTSEWFEAPVDYTYDSYSVNVIWNSQSTATSMNLGDDGYVFLDIRWREVEPTTATATDSE